MPVIKVAKKAKPKAKMPALKVVKQAAPKAAPKVATSLLNVGSKAPDFVMAATQAGKVSSAELKGKPYVLYFYPKDDTPGCTIEACDFTSGIPAFSKLGAMIIGVSKDSMKSHENFSKKFKLKFPLASDESGKVCNAYGVWVEKSMYGKKYMGIERSTFLVDAKGVIRAAWRKVNVPGHVEEVKKALQAL
jgi:thioredoxin-dependent peroxiredoxin